MLVHQYGCVIGENYWDNDGGSLSQGVVELPVAVTVFPKEIYQTPKTWAQRDYPNMFYWNEVSHGGHFAAFEQPQIFVTEMRRAFATIRKS